MKLKLGIQLWTVKEELKNDFRGTLAALSKMGFAGVEFAGDYGGMTPGELAAFLKENNLKCCGLHGRADRLTDPNDTTYNYAKALDSAYVTASYAAKEESEWVSFLPTLEKIGQIAIDKGLTFSYHNHFVELNKFNGRYALDIIFETVSPRLLKAELDIGWIFRGGADPMAFMDKYAGRTPQIHLRDVDPETKEVTDIGKGFINIAAVVEKAEAIGAEWLIYEQDRFPVSAMESCRECVRAIENIKKQDS